MAEKGAHIFAVGNGPDVNGAVTVAGSDVFSVGRPGYGLHKFVITAVRRDSVTCTGMPDAHSLIPVASGNMASIRRPHYSLYQDIAKPMGMAKVSEESSPVGGIPHLHDLISTS